VYLFKEMFFCEPMTTNTPELCHNPLTTLFKEVITELQEEPAFQKETAAFDKDGTPSVKLAVGNAPLHYDLWKGLRNPAVIGVYPAGLQEIWELYAHRRKKGIDESGRPTIFQVPQSFDFALKNYSRVVMVSVMLPFSPRILNEYADVIIKKEKGSSHVFSRMYEDVNSLLDKATTRVALDLVADHNVVIPMNNDTVKSISEEALPVTRQGNSHGPSKGGNYPQKSVAAFLGLGQFGVNRIIFRDEVINGKIHRFTGPLRSLVIFDSEDVVTNEEGIIYLAEQWRHFLFTLYNFTDTDYEVNKYRFCSYIPFNDQGCDLCREYCPSGAQETSIPTPTGEYPEHISRQTHRFWEGKLQFDYGRCCEERGQMATLYPEWSCARGLTMCAAKGRRRVYAAENFYRKMCELTTM